MEQQLRGLKAPRRNEETEQNTFIKLQQDAKKYNRKNKIIISFTSVCAAALMLLLLLTSNNINVFNVTTASSTKIDSVEVFPPTTFEKKYFIGDGLLLSEQHFELLIPLLERLHASTDYYGTQYFNQAYYYNVTYQDNEEELVVFKDRITDKGIEYLFIQSSTLQYINITYEEYAPFYNLYPHTFEKMNAVTDFNPLIDLIKIISILVVYSAYLILAKKISPKARQPLKDEFTVKNMALKLLFLFPLIWLIGILTFEAYGYFNGLHAFYLITFVFLLRKFKEFLDGNSRRKILEIPVSIAFYFICFFIYYM